MSYDIASSDYNLFQVIPYLVVLVGALIGINVFLVLICRNCALDHRWCGNRHDRPVGNVYCGWRRCCFNVRHYSYLDHRGMYRIACPGKWRYTFYPESDQEQDTWKERRAAGIAALGASRGFVYSQQYSGNRNVRTDRKGNQ